MEANNSLQHDLREILQAALRKFGKEENVDQYAEYLESEWYFSVGDLKIAIDDGLAWSDLRLPGRLKLELKQMIIATIRENTSAVWMRCFSIEHDCDYFYNTRNGSTQWDEPVGEDIVNDSSYRQRNNATSGDDQSEHSPPNMPFLSMHSASNGPMTSRDIHQPQSQPQLTRQLNTLSVGISGGQASSPSPMTREQRGSPLPAPLTPTPMAPLRLLSGPQQGVDPSASPTVYYTPVARHSDGGGGGGVGGPAVLSALPLATPIAGHHNDDNTPLVAVEDIDFDILSIPPLELETGTGLDEEVGSFSGPGAAEFGPGPDAGRRTEQLLARLMEMGFVEHDCVRALEMFDNDLSAAAGHLLVTTLPAN